MRSPIRVSLVVAAALAFNLAPARAQAASPQLIILPPSCSYVWAPLGTGCARSISVGPNDVPWILGCPGGNANAKGPDWVYYLSYSNPWGNLISTPTWVYDNFPSAMDVFVNMNSLPIVSGSNGQLYVEDHPDPPTTNDVVPTGIWSAIQTNVATVGSVVVSVGNTNDPYVFTGELFYPWPAPTGENPYFTLNVWGIGCGNVCAEGPYLPLSGNGNGNIFSTEVEFLQGDTTYNPPWQHLPGAAIAVALFTDPPTSATLADGSNLVQNPWVLNEQGQIWIWNASQHDWTQAPLFPTGSQVTRSLTDHYAIDSGNNVWQWNGDSAGAGSWEQVRGLDPGYAGGSGPSIKQIAYSQAAAGSYAGQSGNIGPSQLWGVDYSGNIYSANRTCITQ